MYALEFVWHDFTLYQQEWNDDQYFTALDFAQWADKHPQAGAVRFTKDGEYREIWPQYNIGEDHIDLEWEYLLSVELPSQLDLEDTYENVRRINFIAEVGQCLPLMR